MEKQLSSHQFSKVYKWLGINLSKLGCVMLDLEPLENMYSIEAEGAGIALYYAKNKERFWIDGWVCDKLAHITLLYGILEEGKNYQPHIKEVLKGWEMNDVEIEDIGYFDSPYPDEPYYCLVAHIKTTPKLLEGHQRLQFLPHIDTFTGYKPHMTICYLDKTQGEAYRDRMIKSFRKLWKGKKLKVKSKINLGGNK
jgi:2'-5' RNA ligase